MDLRDAASMKGASKDARFSQMLFCGTSSTHIHAAIRNLCMTAVVLRNLAAAAAKLDRTSSLLASNFLLFPLSFPCHCFLLEPFLFHLSWLFLLLLPPVGVWLAFPFAKDGKAKFPSIAPSKIRHFGAWCTRKSRRISHFLIFQAPAVARGLQRRRCLM